MRNGGGGKKCVGSDGHKARRWRWEKRQWECDGGYASVRGVLVVARMRCVELVSIWIVGGVGAVYDGRDSNGLVKWMEGVVRGMAIVERDAWFIEGVGWSA